MPKTQPIPNTKSSNLKKAQPQPNKQKQKDKRKLARQEHSNHFTSRDTEKF